MHDHRTSHAGAGGGCGRSSAISRKIRGLKDGLTKAERYEVAEHVVRQLKDRGDPWRLSEEARPQKGPTT